MIKELSLRRGQIMTRQDISDTLKTARTGYDYVKIQMRNGIYLQMFFTRDYKAYVKTNSRDLTLWKEIEVFERMMYRPSVAEEFLFRWICKLNIG
jgi:hypothetical protein